MMIFAANFKANHTRAGTKSYIEKLNTLVKKSDDAIYIFPPASALDCYETHATIGVQNGYFATNGAYTGELTLEQIEEFGIKTILIGHSERRELLGESQEMVSKKFEFFKNRGFEIIYCIGESLGVREQGIDAVVSHLRAQLEAIDLDYESLIVAYEPIWAIGTGVSATIEDIKLTHGHLRQITTKPLLYGGSVKAANAKEITAIDNVDGVLVGSASLDAEEFSKIVLG